MVGMFKRVYTCIYVCVCGNDLMSVVDCLTVDRKRREKERVLVG